MDRLARDRCGGVVPFRRDLPALALRQEREIRQAGRGSVGDPRQQGRELPRQPADRGAVEERGVVLQGRGEPAPDRRHLKREVELGAGSRDGERGGGEIPQLQRDPFEPHRERREALPRPAGSRLPGEHHLEHRRPARLARAAQPLGEPGERSVLVREGVQSRAPDAPQQLPERRIAREIAAQDDRIHQVADHPRQAGRAAAGGGRTDRQVDAPGVPQEQHVERREHEHEERRRLLRGQGGQAVQRHPVEPLHPPGTAEPPHRRARPIRRQIERRRAPREPVAPIRPQPLAALSRQPLRLPGHSLGERHRRRQVRRRASRLLPVERPQLPREDRQGPEVGDDVVHRQEENRTVRTAGPDPHPHQRARHQVERPLRLLPQPQRQSPPIRKRLVEHPDIGRQALVDDRDRLPRRGLKRRPQRRMPRHDPLQRTGHRLRIEPPGHNDGLGEDVRRALRRQLVEEPEGALAGGDEERRGGAHADRETGLCGVYFVTPRMGAA